MDILTLIFISLAESCTGTDSLHLQYITTARELLEQLGAEITPEGISRYGIVLCAIGELIC